MRIVGGSHRGRLLVAPKEHSTRPTADRARQAMFNVLEHASWAPALEGAKVLDLFAGSGALGFEALSRGGASCLFIDNGPNARAAIAENARSLGFKDVEVLTLDASRLPPLARTRPAFDLIFIDPPYRQSLAESALRSLRAGAWLAPEALAIIEIGAGEPTSALEGFRLLDERLWGAARVLFLRALASAE